MISLVGCDNVVTTDHFKDHDASLHLNVLSSISEYHINEYHFHKLCSMSNVYEQSCNSKPCCRSEFLVTISLVFRRESYSVRSGNIV